MQYAELSRASLRLSRVGFGCWPIGGHGWGRVDDAVSMAAVRAALDAGITFFDTADVYGLGHSEAILARALGRDRSTAVVATKFGVRWNAAGATWRDMSLNWLEEALHGSLRRLRLDSIPLYQIHWTDGVTPLEPVLERLCAHREAGKIGAIGLCNATADEIARAAAYPVACIQTGYNAIDRRAETAAFDACARAGIEVVTHSSLAQGLCSGKYGVGASFGRDDVRSRSAYFGDSLGASLSVVARMREVGRRHGRTATQVAIGWALGGPGVAAALVGMKTPAQVRENAGALWTLTAAEREFIAHGRLAAAASYMAAEAV